METGTLEPVQGLYCNCCGSLTYGRQWWNRDNGYGICVSCADKQYPNAQVGAETDNGIKGIHFDTPEGKAKEAEDEANFEAWMKEMEQER